MFIVPISNTIQPVESYFDDDKKIVSEEADTPRFSDVFKEVFNEVQETQQVLQEDAVRLTLGEIDDLHTIYNNMTKANIAIETFVAIKDAAVSAYNNVLQITM